MGAMCHKYFTCWFFSPAGGSGFGAVITIPEQLDNSDLFIMHFGGGFIVTQYIIIIHYHQAVVSPGNDKVTFSGELMLLIGAVPVVPELKNIQ
jgi:hypothetical protein